MKKLLGKKVIIVISSFMLVSCYEGSPVNSSDYATAEIDGVVSVKSNGNNETNVLASLSIIREGMYAPVELTGGDILLVEANGISKQLARVKAGQYEALFNFNNSAQYNLSLLRDSGVSSTGASTMLPLPMEILSPVANQVFNSGNSIPITWSPASNHPLLYLGVRVSCNTTTNTIISLSDSFQPVDNGSFTITSNALSPAGIPNIDITKPCTGIITLVRNGAGINDPVMPLVGMSSSQRRTVNVQILPY